MWMDPSVTVIKRHTITGRAGVLICTLTRHFSERWVSSRGANVDGSVGTRLTVVNLSGTAHTTNLSPPVIFKKNVINSPSHMMTPQAKIWWFWHQHFNIIDFRLEIAFLDAKTGRSRTPKIFAALKTR